MEVHLSPELQAKVDRAAAENKSGAEEYVKQLVEHYGDHDAWFRQQATRGLDQLDRGEFLTHEEVGARLDQMFRKQMQVRWAPAAAEDLLRIVEYIRHENPAAAQRTAKTIDQ